MGPGPTAMADYFPTICTHCQRPGRARPEHRGQRVRCKHCGEAFRIPTHVPVPCPGCGDRLRVRPEYAGHRVRCKTCSVAFTVRDEDVRPQVSSFFMLRPADPSRPSSGAIRAWPSDPAVELPMPAAPAPAPAVDEEAPTELDRLAVAADRLIDDAHDRLALRQVQLETARLAAARAAERIAEADALRRDRDGLAIERDGLARQLEVARAEADRLRDERLVAVAAAEESGRQAAAAREVAESLRSDLGRTEAELDRLRDDLRRAEVVAGAATLTAAGRDEALARELDDLRADRDARIEEARRDRADRDTLLADRDGVAAEANRLRADLAQAIAALAELQEASRAAAEEAGRRLAAEAVAVEGRIAAEWGARLADERARSVADRAALAAEHEADRREAERVRDGLLDDLARLRDELRAARPDREATVRLIESLNRELGLLDDERARLREAAEAEGRAARARVVELTAALAAEAEGRAEADRRAVELEFQLREARSELDRERADREADRRDYQRMVSGIHKLGLVRPVAEGTDRPQPPGSTAAVAAPQSEPPTAPTPGPSSASSVALAAAFAADEPGSQAEPRTLSLMDAALSQIGAFAKRPRRPRVD